MYSARPNTVLRRAPGKVLLCIFFEMVSPILGLRNEALLCRQLPSRRRHVRDVVDAWPDARIFDTATGTTFQGLGRDLNESGLGGDRSRGSKFRRLGHRLFLAPPKKGRARSSAAPRASGVDTATFPATASSSTAYYLCEILYNSPPDIFIRLKSRSLHT